MLTTEAEAKTKACPERLRALAAYQMIVQMMPNLGAGIGQSVAIAGPTPSAIVAESCIGSACMAWRWHWNIKIEADHNHVMETQIGFCGKAGRP